MAGVIATIEVFSKEGQTVGTAYIFEDSHLITGDKEAVEKVLQQLQTKKDEER